MSFFEPPSPPREPPEPPRVVERPWWHAPRNELGVSTALRLTLARTEDVAVALVDAVAYSTGLSFNLVIVNRAAGEPFLGHPDPFEHPFGFLRPGRRHGEELPPELLRFGVQFSDGRKATTTGWAGGVLAVFGTDEETEPEDPVLVQGGGGGAEDHWESSFWLWLLEASSRSELLWPASPEGGGGSCTSY